MKEISDEESKRYRRLYISYQKPALQCAGSRGVIPHLTKYIKKEYHSVCLLVGIGTPPSPLPSPSECAPRPEPKRGRTLACGWVGWGSPNSDDWSKSLALCLLCYPHLISQRFVDIWLIWRRNRYSPPRGFLACMNSPSYLELSGNRITPIPFGRPGKA